MKTTIQLLLITALVVLAACSDDVNNLSGIENNLTNEQGVVISDGEVQSPQWLVEAIDSIEQRTRIAPWVYLLEYDGQKYVNVNDWTNSCWSCGELLFNMTGERIRPLADEAESDPQESGEPSGLYQAIMATKHFQEDLIWPKDPSNTRTTTATSGL